MQHDWTPSTLGHGETMCRRCKVTNREAAVLGMDACDVPGEPTGALGEAVTLLRKFCGLFFGRNSDASHMNNDSYAKAHTQLFIEVSDWLREKGYRP